MKPTANKQLTDLITQSWKKPLRIYLISKQLENFYRVQKEGVNLFKNPVLNFLFRYRGRSQATPANKVGSKLDLLVAAIYSSDGLHMRISNYQATLTTKWNTFNSCNDRKCRKYCLWARKGKHFLDGALTIT